MPDTNWQGIKEKNKQVNTKALTKDLQRSLEIQQESATYAVKSSH